MMPDQEAGRREWIALATILVVAVVLRGVHLNNQLWLDEISALTGSISRPFAQIATRWPGSASHILYEMCARVGLLLVGEPAGIRLPAALFGVAGVALAYVFATGAFGRRSALLIASVFAVSYHHVFFSQDARGYTLLMALYLATLALLTRAQARGIGTRLDLTLYALAGALAAYSMPMGWFVLPGEALVVLALWWRASRTRRTPDVPISFFTAAVAGGVLALLLYAPFVVAIARFTRMNAATATEGPRAGLGVLREVLDGLVAAFHGPIGVLVVAAFGLTGMITWWRRHPVSLYAAFAPLLLEGVAVIVAGIGIHPRYFAVALPVLLVVAALGLETFVNALASRLPSTPRVRHAFAAAVLAAIVLASAWPLVHYYRYPKQDFLGAVAAIDRRSPPCRVRVGVNVAGHVLTGYYHANFVTAETLDDLETLERAGGRPLCVVTTLEGLLSASDAALVRHLHERYRRVVVLEGTVGDAAMRIYERDEP